MTEILAFVLGVGAVVFVWVVVVAFKTANKVKELEKQFQALDAELSQRDELVNRRIDQEINRVDQIYNDCTRYTDSRVDKLDAKFCSDGRALTEKSKEFLKG